MQIRIFWPSIYVKHGSPIESLNESLNYETAYAMAQVLAGHERVFLIGLGQCDGVTAESNTRAPDAAL
tara:strand:+ start:2046 stop:2249 length:204 start_codon:yes stop_codon:yes gene_type:complete